MHRILRDCGYALVGGLVLSDVGAMSVEEMHAAYTDGEFRLEMTAIVTADVARVQAVIRDYEHYRELDKRILDARVLERSAPDRLLLFTRLDVCFSVFCRKVERVEEVHELPDGLQAFTLPERSDAVRGDTRARLTADVAGTRIHYTTSIAPKFWIPAWFARRWMLATFRDATVELFTNIEARALSMHFDSSPDPVAHGATAE